MAVADILRTLNAYEALGKTKKVDQVIMDETSIKPRPDFAKIIAACAAGSKAAWRAKTSEQQKQLQSMFAPNPSATSGSGTILTKSYALTKDSKSYLPKRSSGPVKKVDQERETHTKDDRHKETLTRPMQEIEKAPQPPIREI